MNNNITQNPKEEVNKPSAEEMKICSLAWTLSRIGPMYCASRKETGKDIDARLRPVYGIDPRDLLARVRAEIRRQKDHRKSIHQCTREAYKQPCLKCLGLYSPRDCQDTGHCPSCAAALRQKNYQARKQTLKASSIALVKARPKCDAMDKLQLLDAGHLVEGEDEHGDGSSWGGETLTDAEAFREWQQGPDETTEPQSFDDDEQLKELAAQLDREGKRERAREVRKFLAAQGRHF
jgi:hypothetical protein